MPNLRKILNKESNENFIKAQKTVEDFAEKIIKNNFHVNCAFLKINDIAKYEVLFLIPLDDYLSDNFMTIHKLSRKTKKDISDTFYLDFKFRPFIENFNREKIESNELCFKYENGDWTEEG